MVKRQYTISQSMQKEVIEEIQSISKQVMNEEYPIILDETLFEDKDWDKISFTMKDYNRKGGLATLITNVMLPGETDLKQK